MLNSTKVWLVTGGSRGIGQAIVQRALCGGDRVAVLARNPEKVSNENSLSLAADVCDENQLRAAVEQVITVWGRIDVVVNNAGLHRGGKASRLDLKDWEAVLDTNLSGALPATNLTGTIADARFPATLPAVSGANLTNLNIPAGFSELDAALFN